MGPIYYRDSQGAVLVYDVTNPDSLRKVKVWIKELAQMLGDEVCLAIVGNKIDLLNANEQKQPHTNPLIAEAMNYCNQLNNAKHYNTSAKLDTGISDLFISLSRRKLTFDVKQLNPQHQRNNNLPTRLCSFV